MLQFGQALEFRAEIDVDAVGGGRLFEQRFFRGQYQPRQELRIFVDVRGGFAARARCERGDAPSGRIVRKASGAQGLKEGAVGLAVGGQPALGLPGAKTKDGNQRERRR